MKKALFWVALCILGLTNVNAQEINESLDIVASCVKDSIYYNFTISGDGILSYNWGENEDNSTTISVDLSGVTISKDYTFASPKLWINCIDNNSCISEQGRIGAMDGMYFNYSRTYIPAKSQNDLDAMFKHLNYLIKYSTGH